MNNTKLKLYVPLLQRPGQSLKRKAQHQLVPFLKEVLIRRGLSGIDYFKRQVLLIPGLISW